MARIGRGHPNRPIVLRAPRNWDAPPVTVDPYATSFAFPTITAVSPSIGFSIAAYATSFAFPSLTVSFGNSIALEPHATSFTFPPLTITAPILPGELITQNFQVEWGRTVFGGHGNPFQVISLEGWDDLPEIDSGDAPRSARHGSFSGRDFAQARTVSAVIAISDDADGFLGTRRDLRRIIAITEDGSKSTLTIRTDGETLLAYAKAVGRIMPTDYYAQGWTAVSVRWTCPDPRRYDLEQPSVTVAVGSSATCTNDGDIATNPRVKIFGPVTNPIVRNVTLDRIIRFNIALAEGEELEVDTDEGTVVDGDGEDRMSTLSQQSVPVEEWVLAAGPNIISYTASSGGDHGIEVLFRSAFL